MVRHSASRVIGSTVIVVVVLVLAPGTRASAQTIEVMPFAGYRFGGDFFEIATGRPVDADGAPAAGAVVNVALGGGLYVEGLFTGQRARFTTTDLTGEPVQWRVSVDHWQAGGLQELRQHRVRPFLTGVVGLTRYAIEGDNEVRFAVGGGGGVKLFPSPRLGVRLDGRLFATFADIGGRAVACSVSPCFVALDLDVVWQAEFSAGLVVRFP